MPDHDRFGSLSGGAYRKPGTVTGSNPDNFTETPPTDYGANTVVNNHQLTEVYDPHSAANVNLAQKEDFSSEAAPPRAKHYWVYRRDPYAHQGMPTEKYLANSGVDHKADPTVDGGPATL
jgi:hypothetical protein